MAGIKISNLPAIPVAPALTDIFPEVQPAVGGTTYKTTFQQLYDLFILNHGVVNTGAINELAYYAAAGNEVSGLATANNGTLITSAGGVPSISSTLPTAVQNNITVLGAQAETLDMNTHWVSNVLDPVLAQDAATKTYVDTLVANFASVFVARLATTVALTVTYANGSSGVGATLTNAGAMAALSIDGTAAVAGDLVLVKNQASALQNGYYTVTNIGSGATNWVMTRSTKYDQPAEIQPGDIFVITTGTANANTSWIQTATVAAVGVDSIDFTQYSVALPIPVAQGGTGVTTFSAYQLLAAGTTATGALQQIPIGSAGQVLQSAGAGALAAYSTATYPATTTISQLLYSSANNVVAGLATANNGLLTTDGSGVPSISLLSDLGINASLVKTVKIQTISATGTYTPSTGMLYCIAEIIGGGGGGGGVAFNVSNNTSAGGGSGAYARKLYTAAELGANAAVTIGAAGAGGAAGNNNGSNGGNSDFNPAGSGATITANGGLGGTGNGSQWTAAAITGAGGVGGTASNGDVNMPGESGDPGIMLGITASNQMYSGRGGNSFWGAGGASVFGAANGNVGVGFGAGGGGCVSTGSDQAGGAGIIGVCIVTEFCNQ